MVYSTNANLDANLLELASRKVDEVTFNRIVDIGYSNLTVFQKDMITKATEAQVEFYDTYGTDFQGIQSISVGDYSASFTAGMADYRGLCQSSYCFLKQTGLMRRVI